MESTNNKKRIWPIFVVLIFVGSLLYSIFFTVDETELGIILRFGRPLEKVRNPGLHMKLPWPIDHVLRIDNRVLLLKLPSQSLLTSDQKNVQTEPFLIWKISDPILFAATMQDRATAEQRLTDITLAELGVLVGKTPFNAFVNLEASSIQVHQILREGVEFIAKIALGFGITIEDVSLKTFLVPEQNRLSVIDRMIAERGRIAAYYRSKGLEEAMAIEAEAVAEHEKILGQAHADSVAIRGKAEAEALQILGAAYANDPEFYRFIRSLESYETIIGSQSTIFLEADSPLLKYFNGVEAKAIQE